MVAGGDKGGGGYEGAGAETEKCGDGSRKNERDIAGRADISLPHCRAICNSSFKLRFKRYPFAHPQFHTQLSSTLSKDPRTLSASLPPVPRIEKRAPPPKRHKIENLHRHHKPQSQPTSSDPHHQITHPPGPSLNPQTPPNPHNPHHHQIKNPQHSISLSKSQEKLPSIPRRRANLRAQLYLRIKHSTRKSYCR